MRLKDYIINNYVGFIKLISKYWFFIVIAIIIIVFIFNQIVAIIILVIFIILFISYYLQSFLFKNKLIRFMNKYYRIDETTIAKKLMRPLQEIHNQMFDLSNHQKWKDWVIVFLNNRYIFYHKYTIDKFKKLYNRGYNEKEIFENLKEEINMRTRAEIKAIINTLIELNRVNKRNE